jgi:hypothetical protein
VSRQSLISIGSAPRTCPSLAAVSGVVSIVTLVAFLVCGVVLVVSLALVFVVVLVLVFVVVSAAVATSASHISPMRLVMAPRTERGAALVNDNLLGMEPKEEKVARCGYVMRGETAEFELEASLELIVRLGGSRDAQDHQGCSH